MNFFKVILYTILIAYRAVVCQMVEINFEFSWLGIQRLVIGSKNITFSVGSPAFCTGSMHLLSVMTGSLNFLRHLLLATDLKRDWIELLLFHF